MLRGSGPRGTRGPIARPVPARPRAALRGGCCYHPLQEQLGRRGPWDMPASDITVWVFRNPVAAATHLSWCLWACFVTLLLWKLARGDRRRQLSLAAFGLSMVLVYGASGTYHAVRVEEAVLRYFRLVDYSAIYV